jgi:hypothetical protein
MKWRLTQQPTFAGDAALAPFLGESSKMIAHWKAIIFGAVLLAYLVITLYIYVEKKRKEKKRR